jgi:predicted transcriptional regulator
MCSSGLIVVYRFEWICVVQQRLLTIDFSNSDRILGALVSATRRRIVQLIASRTLNINQIAAELGLPQSTVATNVKILEEAGLIEVTVCAAARGGSQKNCTLAYDNLTVKLNPLTRKVDENIIETQMPIGLYSDFNVSPSCGMCSKEKIIGFLDVPKTFYNPERASAELLWFAKGYIEYKFPNNLPPNRQVRSLELSLELCSEAPGFNENWPSDITVWVNGREIGAWTSPGDFGGIRGKLTPGWWRLNATQYGLLKHWIVKTGLFLHRRGQILRRGDRRPQSARFPLDQGEDRDQGECGERGRGQPVRKSLRQLRTGSAAPARARLSAND